MSHYATVILCLPGPLWPVAPPMCGYNASVPVAGITYTTLACGGGLVMYAKLGVFSDLTRTRMLKGACRYRGIGLKACDCQCSVW